MRPDVVEAADEVRDALDERLAAGVSALGLDVAAVSRVALLDFTRLLTKWNARFNLTSVTTPLDMVTVHLLDSLAVVEAVDARSPATLLDVGSGAGFPGIPIAIVRPRLVVRTVDAVAKKIAFQQQVRSTLKLDNLEPRHARVEQFETDPPDVIVSRAYAPLATFVSSVDRLANDRTTLLAMKGAVQSDELAGVPSDWRIDDVRSLDVPFLGARRSLVVMTRRT